MDIKQLEFIIDRHLAGIATAEEKAFISKWLEAAHESNTVFLEASHKEKVKAAMWQSVSRRTGIATQNVAPKTGVLRQIMQRRVWLRYAAAVAVLFVAGLMVYTMMPSTKILNSQLITALPGTQKMLVLPDSSVARLFPGATVSIPENYNETDRNVTSTGRVFFEVRPNADKPFYVHAGNLQTRVLGTSFEVVMNDSIHSSVTVRTGKVGVQYGNLQLAELTPGKCLRYNSKSNSMVIDEVNAAMLCEWWNNGMMFNQAPLEEVIESLANWYNMPIEITNNKWRLEPVTIRIKEQNLSETLSLLSETLGFSYQQQTNKVIIY
jgi:transmembrane sensor